MVSQVYSAKKFYQLQNDGKIAKTLDTSKKLRLDSKGYYLNKKNNKGETYFQRINAEDKVYSRQEGVTMYSKDLDRKRESSHKKEGTKKHGMHPQFEDRESLSSDRKYKI